MDLRIRYSIGFQVGLAMGAEHGAFVASHCAGLVMRNGRGLVIASATAIEIRGRYFLATAGHCLDGLERCRDLYIVAPMGTRGLPYRARGASPERGRHRPDLGWIELDAAVALASGLRFLALDALRPATPRRPNGEVLVHGLPTQLASHRSSERGYRIHLRALGVFSRALGHPGEDTELRIEYDHRETSPLAGGLRQLPAAHGMSGGGVWQLRTASERPRLTGLIRAWHRGERQLRCIPIERWLRWVAECLPELGGYLDPFLASGARSLASTNDPHQHWPGRAGRASRNPNGDGTL